MIYDANLAAAVDEQRAEAEVRARLDTRSLDHGHWMRVGPNTDAALWKVCDGESVEL